jgi:RecB family exonuclease
MVDFPPLSPTALQDFVTCPRRFQLRYLDRLRGPGHIAEPVEEWERRVQLGVDFHRLAQQHLLGLDETLLSRRAASGDPQLAQWWAAYLAHRPPVLAEAHLFPEWPLAITVRDRHLTARLDVLALTAAGTAWIIDWKTTLTKPAGSIWRSG